MTTLTITFPSSLPIADLLFSIQENSPVIYGNVPVNVTNASNTAATTTFVITSPADNIVLGHSYTQTTTMMACSLPPSSTNGLAQTQFLSAIAVSWTQGQPFFTLSALYISADSKQSSTTTLFMPDIIVNMPSGFVCQFRDAQNPVATRSIGPLTTSTNVFVGHPNIQPEFDYITVNGLNQLTDLRSTGPNLLLSAPVSIVQTHNTDPLFFCFNYVDYDGNTGLPVVKAAPRPIYLRGVTFTVSSLVKRTAWFDLVSINTISVATVAPTTLTPQVVNSVIFGIYNDGTTETMSELMQSGVVVNSGTSNLPIDGTYIYLPPAFPVDVTIPGYVALPNPDWFTLDITTNMNFTLTALTDGSNDYSLVQTAFKYSNPTNIVTNTYTVHVIVGAYIQCFTAQCVLDELGQTMEAIHASSHTHTNGTQLATQSGKSYAITDVIREPITARMRFVTFDANSLAPDCPSLPVTLTDMHLVKPRDSDVAFEARPAHAFVNGSSVRFVDSATAAGSQANYIYHVRVDSSFRHEFVLCSNMYVDVMGAT